MDQKFLRERYGEKLQRMARNASSASNAILCGAALRVNSRLTWTCRHARHDGIDILQEPSHYKTRGSSSFFALCLRNTWQGKENLGIQHVDPPLCAGLNEQQVTVRRTG